MNSGSRPPRRSQPRPGNAWTQTSRGLHWEVSVLTPEVFRLRVRQPDASPTFPTDAVVPQDPPEVATRTRQRADALDVATKAGRFRVRPRNRSWVLHDAAGLEVFRSLAGTGSQFVDGKPRFELALESRDALFGLGETAGPWNKRGLIRELWNIDVLAHVPTFFAGLRSMYVSIPFLLMLREGRAAGLFWDNPARQVWDLGSTKPDRLVVSADSGELDLYLFLGPTPADVVRQFTALTGRTPLPPRWALGYHQCRYSYETQRRVEEVAREFRRRRIPCDALYLDIHHLDGFRTFTFGRSFPQPGAMIRRLHRQGFRVVTIVDPGIRVDPAWGVFRRGRRQGAFVRTPNDREDVVGRVWPERACFPDFLNAAVRAWWGREQARSQQLGVDGFWNDMNEPSNFARPEKTLDPACRHRTDHGPARHGTVHNLYGSAMARASREGALAQRPDERPFIITRSGYAGIQRHALVWTGDNSSSWEHLAGTIPMLLNLGLSGVAFCGSDVGGFTEHTTPELLVRWMQLASLTPFFRNHSNDGTRDQEPWAFGPEVETICRSAIELRYQLLPYLYGRFVEAHRHGAPVMRPLAWSHPNDPLAVACADQYLVGNDLLVAPVIQPGAGARSVFLPSGSWYDFRTGEHHAGRQHVLATAGLATLPLYVRAGAILPLVDVRQNLAGPAPDLINLHVWPGAPGELAWFEDAGTTPAAELGEFSERTLRYRPTSRGGRLEFGPAVGPRASEVRVWRILLRDVSRAVRVCCDGKRVRSTHVPEASLVILELANMPTPMVVEWK